MATLITNNPMKLTSSLIVSMMLYFCLTITAHASFINLSPNEQAWIKTHRSIKISGPQAFPPFQYNDTDGSFKGMASDYVSLITKMVGLEIEIVNNLPWEEILKKTENGEIDLLTCTARTPDREKYLIFAKPHLSFPLVIISRKDAPFISGPQSLNNKKIAVVKKNAALDLLQRDRISVTPVFADSPLNVLKAVALGEADASIENLATATYLIEKYGLANLKIAAPTSYENYDLSIAVRRDMPELASIFSKGLDAIDKDTHNEIRQKWIAVRYEHGVSVRDIIKWVLLALVIVILPLIVFYLSNRKLKKEIQMRFLMEAENEKLIGDLKKSEQEHLKITEDLKESQQIAHVGSWRMDLATNKVEWSEEFYKMFGFDSKLPPLPFTESEKLFTSESWERLSTSAQNTLNTGIPYSIELEFTRVDGSSGWMWAYGRPAIDASGTTVGLKGMAQDITERKRNEQNAVKNENRFRSLFNEMTEGVALHSVMRNGSGSIIDYRIEMVNPAYSDILGIFPQDVTGKLATDAYKTDTPPYLKEYSDVVESRIPFRFTTYFLDMDKHFDISVIPWESSGFATIFLDITARINAEQFQRQQEEKLQHTQKLESLGVLAGGIAHDFNNILAIIMGYCSLTKMDYETAENNIPEIEKAVERAAGLCRQMLAYAGKAQLAMSQVNMSMLVNEMITMLKSTLPQNAEINPELPANIPFINGDASQIRQIIMNLIINASEAIGNGHGEIRVSLATTIIKTGQSVEDYNGKTILPGEYVCLEVTDNGCGMDEETKWRIFEPFYTTRQRSVGAVPKERHRYYPGYDRHGYADHGWI